MFDKFGEFDSYEEINRAAKAQLEEGDLEAIRTIAEENGLDPEDHSVFGCDWKAGTGNEGPETGRSTEGLDRFHQTILHGK